MQLLFIGILVFVGYFVLKAIIEVTAENKQKEMERGKVKKERRSSRQRENRCKNKRGGAGGKKEWRKHFRE